MSTCVILVNVWVENVCVLSVQWLLSALCLCPSCLLVVDSRHRLPGVSSCGLPLSGATSRHRAAVGLGVPLVYTQACSHVSTCVNAVICKMSWRLSARRRCLSADVTVKLVVSLLLSCLCYCNCLFCCIPVTVCHTMDRTENVTSCLMWMFDHVITSALVWLSPFLSCCESPHQRGSRDLPSCFTLPSPSHTLNSFSGWHTPAPHSPQSGSTFSTLGLHILHTWAPHSPHSGSTFFTPLCWPVYRRWCQCQQDSWQLRLFASSTCLKLFKMSFKFSRESWTVSRDEFVLRVSWKLRKKRTTIICDLYLSSHLRNCIVWCQTLVSLLMEAWIQIILSKFVGISK